MHSFFECTATPRALGSIAQPSIPPPYYLRNWYLSQLRLSEGSFLNGLPRLSLSSGHTHSDYYVRNATSEFQKSTPEEEIEKLRNALRLSGRPPPKKNETLARGWDFLNRGAVYGSDLKTSLQPTIPKVREEAAMT